MRETSLPFARPGRAAVWAATALGGIAVLLQAALFGLEGGGTGRLLWGDEISYLAAARRLLQGLPSDLDPLWPPLYPHLLAALGGSRLAVEIAQMFLLIAAALLLADFARLAYGVRRGERGGARLAGAIAGGLLLADAQAAAFAHYLWPEIVHLFLFAAVLWGLLRLTLRRLDEADRTERPDRSADAARPIPGWAFALLGATLGLALQAKSLLLPFLPVLVWPLVRRLGWRRAVLPLAVAGVALGAALLPTLLANARSGIGFRLADSSRFNLWVGLNDTSRRNLIGEIVGREFDAYRTSAPTYPEREAILDGKVERLVAREGLGTLAVRQLERQPFRLFDRDSFFTDQLPGGAIVASGFGYRGVSAWTAGSLRALGIAVYVLVLLGAILGIARGRSAWSADSSRFRTVLLTFLAYNLILFLALHVKTRYRVQILPALDVFAAFGLAGLWEGWRPSRRAAVGAIGAAILILGLVFGGRALDARWPQTPLRPLDSGTVTP